MLKEFYIAFILWNLKSVLMVLKSNFSIRLSGPIYKTLSLTNRVYLDPFKPTISLYLSLVKDISPSSDWNDPYDE